MPKAKLRLNAIKEEASQTECDNCGEFYPDFKEKCPHCGTVNLDIHHKFN